MVIDATALHKDFEGPPPISVLLGVDLCVAPGERVAVHGRSGAGKSTLLNILGLLDRADAGTYRLAGIDVATMSNRERDRLRSTEIGFVFQSHHIISHRTAAQNLDLKLDILAVPAADRAPMIERALAEVGMLGHLHAQGRTLSGGEKQRLALARAIVAQPSVILADEPTGNLDDGNSTDVLGLLSREAARGAAVVVITHDTRIGAWADRSVMLADGVARELTP
jgi:putative ABC transport system ATP-binding protein